jgi:Fe-S-cluster containining protein
MSEREDILKRYVDLLREVDQWFASCTERYPGQITCSGGCSSCCRGLFDITLLDAELLRSGYHTLPKDVQMAVAGKSALRIAGIRATWPDFEPPYLLNKYPEEEWSQIMPEEDSTPCVLLDSHGFCALYEYRPLTCRLHGLPLVELSGEVMDESYCPLNFTEQDPFEFNGLRADFSAIFHKETRLIAEFTAFLTGVETAQMDTLIPAALL